MQIGETMPVIKSLEELNHVRENILAMRQSKFDAGNRRVIISMGSCGIAVGARETLQSFLNYIQNEHITNISVAQTGCIGLCEQEPTVQVILGNQSKVVYGKVDEQIARKIMEQHIQNGQPLTEHIIQVGNSILGS
jgi:(2Fe-2S) ferredoxin